MKKFLSVLLALAMIFSLTVTVSADETKGEMDGYVVVLHTNDCHNVGKFRYFLIIRQPFFQFCFSFLHFGHRV